MSIVDATERCGTYLNEKTRVFLYNSLIQPHLRYLSPCWGNASQDLLNKLQRLQNRAVKIIYGFDYYMSTVDVYRKTQIFNIKKLITFEQITQLVYKIKTNNIKINSKIKQVHDCHEYNVRKKHNLRNDYARTKTAHSYPIYGSIQIYNI